MTSRKQKQNKELIIAAFQELWKTQPSEEEFIKYTDGLVMFPAMGYTVTSVTWKKPKPHNIDFSKTTLK